ncbi:MAG: PilZ domain-containing protein [Synechococcaceae cyanobacterium SM1_2_3]|nr:PilZ domain-containing protein [Synechococcaceae cyanobacterium SM1_2_3]
MPAPTTTVELPAAISFDPEKREFYRLHFPFPERPRFIMGVSDYEVADCSAQGFCCIVVPRASLLPGDRVRGFLQFRRHKDITVRGRITRIHGDRMSIYMPDSEIPLTFLWSEERYLLKHYPMRENQPVSTAPLALIETGY